MKKLILVSTGAFENTYNIDLMKIRLSRLNQQGRAEAEKLISEINLGKPDINTLKEFGRLMTFADSYYYLPSENDSFELNINIFQSVWDEASRIRESKDLINCANQIMRPVVAIHGDYDSHPIDGVQKLLTERLSDFKMNVIKDCGHTPWGKDLQRINFIKYCEMNYVLDSLNENRIGY